MIISKLWTNILYLHELNFLFLERILRPENFVPSRKENGLVDKR